MMFLQFRSICIYLIYPRGKKSRVMVRVLISSFCLFLFFNLLVEACFACVCVCVLECRESCQSLTGRRSHEPGSASVIFKKVAFDCSGCNGDKKANIIYFIFFFTGLEASFLELFSYFRKMEMSSILLLPNSPLCTNTHTHVTVSTVNINKPSDDLQSAVWGSVRMPHLLFFHTAQGHMRSESLNTSPSSWYEHM